MKRAFFSLTNSAGAAEFATGLLDLGYELVATSGTAKGLEAHGLPVTRAEDLTGFADLLGGRVKTLHPKIHGGLLARRTERDKADLQSVGAAPFDLLICNLYDFASAAKEDDASEESLIEHIDIGGVALLRAAAKNAAFCPPVCDPEDYPALLEELKKGELTAGTRHKLAVKAFDTTARYDRLIADRLAQFYDCPLAEPLRYGENPWQPAWTRPSQTWRCLGGKQLSYNNLLDLDAALLALDLTSDDEPTVTLIKHTTPCGVGQGSTLTEAFDAAFACDTRSPFGGVAVLSRPLDLPAARRLTDLFLELIVVPDAHPDAARLVQEKWKNARIVVAEELSKDLITRRVNRAGELIQRESCPEVPDFKALPWVGTPRDDRMSELTLAWKAAALAKSNAIALVKGNATVGIGGGFTSRIDALEYALKIAGPRAQGSVLASDAFFPFPDSIEAAAAAGVEIIVQPGGSVKDEAVFEAVRRLGLSMVLTGRRTFRH